MKNLSRRDFLKSAAAGAAGIGLMSVGLVGCGSSSSTDEETTEAATTAAAVEETEAVVEETTSTASTAITETIYSSASWRIKPDAVDESLITETYDADVCVVGLGHAGATATVELSEEGFSVIAIEKKYEENYGTTGHDTGHINSELSESLGGGSGYDPIEFYNNWMLNSANAANPTLAMKFAQKSGENVDWWYEKTNGDASPYLVFEPANDERPNIVTEVGPFHFYCTSVAFDDSVCIPNCKESIESDGVSKILFGYTGEYLLQDDDGAVTGVIVQNTDSGEYAQINCSAVVLSTGGFGGNSEMVSDLLVDLKYVLQENDNFNEMGMDSAGDGIRMGYWAGGRMEINPATMDGRAVWQSGNPAQVPMLSHPQGIHLDYTGRRFYNEYWGPIEMRSKPLSHMNRSLFYAVFDDNLTTYMQYVPASHGTTDPTTETLASVREIMDAAYAVKGTGYTDEDRNCVWYAGDTIQECIDAIGMDEKVANNVIASVDSWNAICEAGEDSEFGRQSDFLFPINQGPYYIQVNENNETLGNFLVTMGGLLTDGDQRVLGEDWYPIPGLFASGNTIGGRFGWDYFSPCYGVSVGMAVTLGRECGKSVGQYLNGELV